MPFLRVVEVFPPLLRSGDSGRGPDLKRRITSFVEGVRQVRGYADLVLVASLKDPLLTTVSTTSAASIVLQQAGIDAAPVIVARDSNRKEIASTILGAYSLGLGSLMLAWGDRAPSDGSRNVYDFPSLSNMIALARRISLVSGTRIRLLAPVDLDKLSDADGVRLAKSRLAAGADLLLAQPPTTDSFETFDRHLKVIESSGLKSSVLPGVFPFKDGKDVLRSEKYFAWRLPPSLRLRAASPEFSPVGEARAVVKRLREEGFPGVYLSTRGSPELARQILG